MKNASNALAISVKTYKSHAQLPDLHRREKLDISPAEQDKRGQLRHSMSSANCPVASSVAASEAGKSHQTQQLASLRLKNEQLSKEIEALRRKSNEHVAQLQAELTLVRSDLGAQKERNAALEADAQRRAIDTELMRQDVLSLRKTNELLLRANEQFRGEIKEAKRYLAEYEQKFSSVMQEMSVLYGNLEHAEALRRELQQENEILQGNSTSTTLVAPNSQRLKDAATQIAVLKGQLEEAVAALRDVSRAQLDQSSMEELRRQVDELREREARHLDIIKSSVMIMENLRAQNARRKEDLGGKPPLSE